MSAPKLISPLLDNFIMGEPIFDQGGVRILPAMKQVCEEKYIVKIISIPASQSQVDALLITGAYKDAEAVNGYFSELAGGIVKEAEILNQLSNAGGFDKFEGYQIVPMDDGNGYDVYLLAPYLPTWSRVSQQKPVTQLDGYNLALDLCAALSVARRNNYLFTNLSPDSVCVTPSGSYHINDLGFVGLDYLQYSSLPAGHFSAYTAPEILDAYSSLNDTLDVYALGMMLYEIFNNGLPFDGNRASATEYPAPAFADEEFAEIILKAIHPDPSLRWQNPTEMGQAIVSVMQRKGVSDAPIVPVVEMVEEETQPEEAIIADETVDATESLPVDELIEDLATEDAQSEDVVAEEVDEVVEESTPAADEQELPETIEDEICDCETATEEISFDENQDNILEEADRLLEELDECTKEVEGFEQLTIDEPSPDEEPEEFQPEEDTAEPAPIPPEDQPNSEPKKSGKKVALVICLSVLLALIITAGLFFYRHIYMQEIDSLQIEGAADTILVSIVTDMDSSELKVVCTDEDGNAFEANFDNYKASISGLAANASYTISIQANGFHKLFGQTEDTYTTPEKTIISDFKVLNGTEEGTAEVSFDITGPNKGVWSVIFSAQSQPAIVATANDGKATIQGLTLDTEYTVTLSNSEPLYLDENIELKFTPGPVLRPINPYVLSFVDGVMTVQWSTPATDSTLSWIVRCYNAEGYNKAVTVTDTTVSFEGLDSNSEYSVEISAVGQAATEAIQVTANAITLSDFIVDTSVNGNITISWTASAEVPEGGYMITYTVDDVIVNDTLQTSKNSFTFKHAVPEAVHKFTILCTNGQSVLYAPVSATASGEESFSGFGIKANNMRFNLCPRPATTNWTYKDVKTSSYTTTFTVGQKVSVVGRILSKYYGSDEVVGTVYVFKDATNAIIHTCFTEESWSDMWSNGYATFDIPSIPEQPGPYKLEMYIDGGLVHSANITIK